PQQRRGTDCMTGRAAAWIPATPSTRTSTTWPPEQLAQVPSAPGSLEEALDALEADHQLLLKDDVFTDDVIETHLAYKRSHEIDCAQLVVTRNWQAAFRDDGLACGAAIPSRTEAPDTTWREP